MAGKMVDATQILEREVGRQEKRERKREKEKKERKEERPERLRRADAF